MKYIILYDIEFDETFQFEVDDETAERAKLAGVTIGDAPFPNMRIKRRDQSDLHPPTICGELDPSDGA